MVEKYGLLVMQAMAKLEGQRSHSVSLFSHYLFKNNIIFRRRENWLSKKFLYSCNNFLDEYFDIE